MQNSQVIAEGLTFIYAIPAEHLHNWHVKRVCKFLNGFGNITINWLILIEKPFCLS